MAENWWDDGVAAARAAPPGGGSWWADGVPGARTPTARAAADIGDALKAGLQSSSMGLMIRGKLPDVALDESAPWYMRAAAGVGQVAGDFIPGVAGAVGGGLTGTAVGGPVGTLVGGGAGAFAAPMAIRDALVRAYSNNYATTGEAVLDIGMAALKGGGKGAVIGGATFGAGALAARTVGAAIAPGVGISTGTTAARATITAAGTGAELATMTTASAALEGRMPTAQEFLDNAILLGGMKAAFGTAAKLREIYAQTGKLPNEVLGDAARDPRIALDVKPVEKPLKGDYIEAWHGSPHTFDKFDTAKIGTGEGAQAYGRGLYFAENEKVAKSYRTDIPLVQFNGSFTVNDLVSRFAAETQSSDKSVIFTAIQAARENGFGTKFGQAFADALRDIKSANDLPDVGLQKGGLYRVQISKAAVESMIDWDKPFSEQAEVVQKFGKFLRPRDGETTVGETLRRVRKDGDPEPDLLAAGIRGIKYFDEGSRTEKSGTRNFVVFSAQDVRVTERNGEAINQVPEAYRVLALEERVKAALDTDKRPELARALIDEARGKYDPNAARDLIRYEYITDRETFDTVVKAIVETYGEQIESQRRGVVPVKESMAEGAILATSAGFKPHEIGQAANASEAAARAFLVRGAAERVKALAAEFDGTPFEARSVGQQLQLHAAIEQVGIFYGQLAGGVAEAARTLQLMGQLKRNPELLGDAKVLLDAYNAKGKDIGSLTGMLQAMKDPQQMAKFAAELQKATTLEKVLEVYRANLFSGFLTHLANPLGNFTKWVVDVPESIVAATLTAAQRAASGDPLSMAQWKARAFAPVIGWQLGARDGVIAAAEVFTQKQQILDKVEVARVANEGKLGLYTGTVFRALQAEDMLFRVPAERAKAYILAVDRAVKEGFNPATQEGEAAISRYMNQPAWGLTEKAAGKVTAEIAQAGAEAVFAQKLGPFNAGVQHAIQGTLAQFIIPAYRTPANLLSWAVQHTPGINLLSARWRADFMAGGEQQAQATARLLIGTGLAMTAYSLAESGIITGSGIFDKEQSGTKRAAGWQPNSIKIGDKYYSFERIEPLAKVLTMTADLVELGKVTKDEEDRAKIGMMLIMGFGNATISTTYMSGLASTLKAVTDPQRNAENWFEGYAASLVPKAIGQVVTAIDPHKREVDGVLDAIQGQLPFLREKLLPKRDVWGEPMKNDRWFDVMPVTVTEASKDKVRTEAMRLQLAIMDAPRSLLESGPFKQKDRDIKLTPEQRDIMREVTGKNAMEILSPIVNAPDWDQIPDFAKGAIYKNVLEGTRKQGAYAALPADAAERAKMREKIIEKVIKQTKDAEGR